MTSVTKLNSQQPPANVVKFKAGENDVQRRQGQPVITNPQILRQPMNDEVRLQRMIEQQQKEQKKAKRKNNIMTGVSIASGVAIIAMVLMQFRAMRAGEAMGKVGKEVQEIVTRNVAKEKSLEQLKMGKELTQATDDVKLLIERAEELARKGASGNSAIMLYGEPGGGKNAWVYGITKWMQEKVPGSELIMMDVLKFKGMYNGQTENNILGFVDNVISHANANPQKRFVIFLDEFDSIARIDNGANAASSSTFQNAFKTSFNKLLEIPNIQVVAATNKASKEEALTTLLDEAIVNRFAKKVFVPLPNKEQIKNSIVEQYKSLPEDVVAKELRDINNPVIDKLCEYITTKEHHASFRDMNYIIDKARLLSESGEKSAPISIDNLIQATKDISESMNWHDLHKLAV